jgi:hypothetical protein
VSGLGPSPSTKENRRRLHPLSERVLARLPGRALPWIALWALVPWANAGLNLLLESERTSAVWEQDDVLVVLNYAAITVAVLLSLWGAPTIARRLEALHVASIGLAAGLGAATLVDDGWPPAVLRGLTWFVLGVALFSFMWTYGAVLLGLNRLGRARLDPDAPHVDPGLGLQPLGAVAATCLWMLLAWLVPVLLTGLPDVVGAIFGGLVLGAALVTFFLSMVGLHRQMVTVKQAELARARELYARAYEPVHASPTLEVLEQQRNLLAAAEALEKRAAAIHEWPFTERAPTVVLTVVTSVVAMTIGRLILDPFGL